MTDKQLLHIATEFRKGLLGDGPSDCMCRVVCYPLCGLLHTMGVGVEILDVEVERSIRGRLTTILDTYPRLVYATRQPKGGGSLNQISQSSTLNLQRRIEWE